MMKSIIKPVVTPSAIVHLVKISEFLNLLSPRFFPTNAVEAIEMPTLKIKIFT